MVFFQQEYPMPVKRILIVDDSLTERQYLSELLSERSLSLRPAAATLSLPSRSQAARGRRSPMAKHLHPPCARPRPPRPSHLTGASVPRLAPMFTHPGRQPFSQRSQSVPCSRSSRISCTVTEIMMRGYSTNVCVRRSTD